MLLETSENHFGVSSAYVDDFNEKKQDNPLSLTFTILGQGDMGVRSDVSEECNVGDLTNLKKQKKTRKKGMKYNIKKKDQEILNKIKIQRKVDTNLKFDWIRKMLTLFLKHQNQETSIAVNEKITKAGKISKSSKLSKRSWPYLFISLKVFKNLGIGEKFLRLLEENFEILEEPISSYRCKYLQETYVMIIKFCKMMIFQNQFNAIKQAYMRRPSGRISGTKCPSRSKEFQELYLELFSSQDRKPYIL